MRSGPKPTIVEAEVIALDEEGKHADVFIGVELLENVQIEGRKPNPKDTVLVTIWPDKDPSLELIEEGADPFSAFFGCTLPSLACVT